MLSFLESCWRILIPGASRSLAQTAPAAAELRRFCRPTSSEHMFQQGKSPRVVLCVYMSTFGGGSVRRYSGQRECNLFVCIFGHFRLIFRLSLLMFRSLPTLQYTLSTSTFCCGRPARQLMSSLPLAQWLTSRRVGRLISIIQRHIKAYKIVVNVPITARLTCINAIYICIDMSFHR